MNPGSGTKFYPSHWLSSHCPPPGPEDHTCIAVSRSTLDGVGAQVGLARQGVLVLAAQVPLPAQRGSWEVECLTLWGSQHLGLLGTFGTKLWYLAGYGGGVTQAIRVERPGYLRGAGPSWDPELDTELSLACFSLCCCFCGKPWLLGYSESQPQSGLSLAQF